MEKTFRNTCDEVGFPCRKSATGIPTAAGCKAPVRPKTFGPHVLASIVQIDPVLIGRFPFTAVLAECDYWLCRVLFVQLETLEELKMGITVLLAASVVDFRPVDGVF